MPSGWPTYWPMACSNPAAFPLPPCARCASWWAIVVSTVQARTQEINRVHKLLELGNIKLAAVATDVLGKSGRAMLHGLVAGDHDPEARAA